MIIRKRGINRENFPHRQEAMAIIRNCQELARTLHPAFTLSDKELPVVFFNGGTTAGYARWRKINGRDYYNIEINVQAIEVDWEDTWQDTIPHEMAHIVNRFINGKKPPVHGVKWKRIAKTLGCSGERCHDLPLMKIRNRSRLPREFIYRGGRGVDLALTQIRHNKLQRGKMLWYSTQAAGRVYKGDYIGTAKLTHALM